MNDAIESQPWRIGVFLAGRAKGLPPIDQIVYTWLANHNNWGETVSTQTLATECGTTTEKVERSIHRLTRTHLLLTEDGRVMI